MLRIFPSIVFSYTLCNFEIPFVGRDWNFAVVVRGSRVPYGEAGDCYSKASCPQGQFRINLESTGFRVSKGQQWSQDGNHALKSIQKYEVLFVVFRWLCDSLRITVLSIYTGWQL